MILETYEVKCVQCGKLKWPALPEKPLRYVCVLCRSGVGSKRREAGREHGFKAKSRPGPAISGQ